MTILAVGDEVESWSNPLNTTSDVQTVAKDTGQRGGIVAVNATPWDLLHASVSEVWMRMIMRFGSNSSTTTPVFSFRNTSTGKDAFRCCFGNIGGRNGLRFQYNDTGTNYATINDTDWGGASAANSQKPIDIYFKSGASGVLRVFLNGRLALDLTGNYTTVDATWNALRLQSAGSSGNSYGGVIIADEPTLGMTVDHLSPNGSGSVSTWSGNFNSLADTSVAPRMDLTNSISSNTPAESFLATMEDTSTHASKEVRALQIAARGILEAASGISSVSFLARESGTNYTLDNLGLTSSASSFQQVLNSSPAGNAWSDSIVNAIELGVISA